MSNLFSRLILLIVLTALPLSYGCEDKVIFRNAPPSQLELNRDRCYIWTNGDLHLSGNAVDGDDDPLAFRWTASGNRGSFEPASGEGKSVTWTAPGKPGRIRITMIVSDIFEERSKSIDVVVGEMLPMSITSDMVVRDNGFVYIIAGGGPMVVPANLTLTLKPGVDIIVDRDTGGMLVKGTLRAEGKRDSVVTIGANTCTEGKGLWDRLRITESSASGYLKYFNLMSSDHGLVVDLESRLVLENSEIVNNVYSGLSVVDYSQATVSGCRFYNNGKGVYIRDAELELSSANITDNDVGVVMSASAALYDMSIYGSTVANNSLDGILVTERAKPVINMCSIFNNGVGNINNYALRLFTYLESDSVDAANNFWGSGNITEEKISEVIFDRKDSRELSNAYVKFVPYLQEAPAW